MPAQGSQGPMSKKEELFYRQSQGRAHLFMDMRIVNDAGAELPWDGKAAGELQVRGPHVLKAYFRVGFCSIYLCSMASAVLRACSIQMLTCYTHLQCHMRQCHVAMHTIDTPCENQLASVCALFVIMVRDSCTVRSMQCVTFHLMHAL